MAYLAVSVKIYAIQPNVPGGDIVQYLIWFEYGKLPEGKEIVELAHTN